MKLFECERCGNLLYFEDRQCARCGSTLGFVPDRLDLLALEPAGAPHWRAGTDPEGQASYRMCVNYADHQVCNWMVPADSVSTFCTACDLNRTIPDLQVAGNRALWSALETEKRRLVYSLLRLGLPLTSLNHDPDGLAFDFLADAPPGFSERGRVITGHSEGLITINIAEADPVERERMRDSMDEPYRTILGHFRHESGHYYWNRLIRNQPVQAEFRRLFGDERIDYAEALERHYREGPDPNWQQTHVSAYASSHPWEDWAETWAHYLHMLDTLETAHQLGLSLQPRISDEQPVEIEHDRNAYHQSRFQWLIERWLPLTYAMNNLNRSMGHPGAYPFELKPTAIGKLAFVHKVIRGAAGNGSPDRRTRA